MQNDEQAFMDCARRWFRHPKGRRVVIFRLSMLGPENRRPHHLGHAAYVCEKLLGIRSGHVFRFCNSDMVLAVDGASDAELRETSGRMLFLFSLDPCFGQEGASEAFASLFSLENRKDVQFLTTFGEKALARARKIRLFGDDAGNRTGRGRSLREADLHLLDQMISALSHADLSAYLVPRHICTLGSPGETAEVAMTELEVNVGALCARVAPGIDLPDSHGLGNYLKKTLDARLLCTLPHVLARRERGMDILLKLGTGTVLSDTFIAFDRKMIRSGQKDDFRIVVEFDYRDVFADVQGFIFARDFLHEQGYRVSTGSLNYMVLPFLDCGRTECDWFRILWSRDLCAPAAGSQASRALAALGTLGGERLILDRCDTPQALEFGLRGQIRHLQGKMVDSVLRQSGGDGKVRKVAATAAPERQLS